MEASFRRYGFLQIKEYGRQFVEYKQLVVNFANALAMTLENQWQQECLRTANIELEKHRNNLEELVEEQTGELRKLSIAVGRAFGSVIITDKNGKIEYVNQAFCKMTGFNHAEVIGKNPQLINSGKHPKQFFQELWDVIGVLDYLTVHYHHRMHLKDIEDGGTVKKIGVILANTG